MAVLFSVDFNKCFFSVASVDRGLSVVLSSQERDVAWSRAFEQVMILSEIYPVYIEMVSYKMMSYAKNRT